MRHSLFLICIAVLVTACAPGIEQEASSEFSAEELYPVRGSGFAQAFVRRDAGLASYREVIVEPLGVADIDIPRTAVAGTLRRDWQMTPEKEAGLTAEWGRAMNRAFSGYPRVASGQGVVRIAARLTRIAPGRPTATTIGGELQPPGSTQDAVEISAEFRLYDDANGRLLAVIRDTRSIISVSMSRTAPVTVVKLFGSWAATLHTRISGK